MSINPNKLKIRWTHSQDLVPPLNKRTFDPIVFFHPLVLVKKYLILIKKLKAYIYKIK